MATIREIKEKQLSIQSINKITNSMKLVSIAKSKRAIDRLHAYQAYYQKFLEVMEKFYDEKEQLKLEKERNNTLWVVFLTDMGLVGGFNSRIVNKLLEDIKVNDKLLIIGKKAPSLINRLPFSNVNAEIISLKEFFKTSVLSNVQTRMQIAFHDQNCIVKVIFNRFISLLTFETNVKQIFPIDLKELFAGAEEFKIKPYKEEGKLASVIEFEPNKSFLLKAMEPIYLQVILYYCAYQGMAAEHSARRVAMDNAAKNGDDLLKKLRLEYNQRRQAKITQEISEIVAGAEAS